MKKIFALLTVALLTLALLPYATFAAATETASSEAELNAAAVNVDDGGTIKITGNFSVSSAVYITGTKSITIDLNGHTVTNRGTVNGAIVIQNSASVTFIDSVGNGELKTPSADTVTKLIVNNGTGDVTVLSGKYTCSVGGGAASGRTIASTSSGNVILNGGTLSIAGAASAAIWLSSAASGNVSILSGTINATNQGTGINNGGSGSVNMSGGSINAVNTGISCSGGGNVNISGGSITATDSA